MRSYTRKRSEDTWTVAISLGHDPTTGKRRRKWLTVRGTKNDTEAEVTRILAEHDRGLSVDPNKTIDWMGRSPWTPLMWAADEGRVDAVVPLLDPN